MDFENILNIILPHLLTFAGLYIAVFFAVSADLVAGVRKAKKLGFFRSSRGLRRTVAKVGRYFNMMFVVTIIDGVQMVALWEGHFSLPIMPFFSFIAAIFLCIIELRSIYEKNSEKEKAEIQEIAVLLAKAAKDKDVQKTLSNITEYITNNK